MSNIESIRALWQSCFHDEESFADLFFSQVFTPANTLTVEQSGHLIAMLQMLPYTFAAWNTEWPCAYVAGVATTPEERNKGVMNNLLSEALQEMYSRHIPLSLLIPADAWLYGYYARSGYASVCHTRQMQISVPADMPSGYQEKAVSPDKQFAFYDAISRSRESAVLHTRSDYEVILADHKLSGGSVHTIVTKNGSLAALGLALSRNDKILLKDFVASDTDSGNALFHAVSRYYGISTILCNQPAATGSPRAMIRVTDIQTILPVWAKHHSEMNIQLQITDSRISANNGCWHISNGDVYPLSHPTEETCHLSIAELTALLFGQGDLASTHGISPLCPYVTLMLD